MSKYNIITILGPTAGGKTRLAAELAYKLNGAVISADSRQVYRDMTIGTGKDYDDYIVNDKLIPSYLVDIREAGQKYNLFEFKADFIKVYKQLTSQGMMPILCGGSGLYIEAVIKDYRLVDVPVNNELRTELEFKTDTELQQMLANLVSLHNKSDFDTRKRTLRAVEIALYQQQHKIDDYNVPSINSLFIGVKYDREIQRHRITTRLLERLNNGMVKEVEALLNKGIAADDLIYYGLEYKFITMFLTKKISYNEMVSGLNTAIHQFAKRQMTWFRKMEREGILIHWLNPEDSMPEKVDKVLRLFNEE